MSWKDTKAIERIFNTFSRVKKGIYDQDIEALKQLNETIEAQSAKAANDNLLYSKLLCVVLRLNIDHYKDVRMGIKKTSDFLNSPLDTHIHFLTKTLNEVDLNNYFDGVECPNACQSEIIEKLNSNWTEEKVKSSFYKTANEFLKDVDNYK